MVVGCIQCHNGALLGGNSYQKMGKLNPYETKDLGRYNVRKKKKINICLKYPL
jgi:cytochrome c peroxidase